MNFSKFFLAVLAFAALFAVFANGMPSDVKNLLRRQKKSDNKKPVTLKSLKADTDLASLRVVRANPGTLRNDTFTISGISAGAAFSIQYGIAFSSTVQANGIIAGIPYYCSQGMMAYALTCMDAPELINIQNIISQAQTYQEWGLIDNMDFIKNHYLHLWSGTSDTVVLQGVMMQVAEMYEYMGVTAMATIFNYSSEHAWITNKYGNDCSYLGEPYVNNCGYDYSGEFLSRSWRHMQNGGAIANLTSFNTTQGVMNKNHFYTFDQTKYGANAGSNSIARVGYLYVPPQCGTVSTSGANTVLSNPTKKCHLHLNFHGCTQQADLLGLDYIAQTNLNEYAESNDIVILYPQSTTNMMNPKGCFAWWDFDGMDTNFANKQGVQMKMMREMVENLQLYGQI